MMENSKKDILFLCQFFYPEYNSSATLPFDTAKFLASHGFTVDALVGYPKEYSVDKHLPRNETVDGVSIKRIKYWQLGRAGTIGRLINYFSFTFRAWLKTSYLKNYKTVIVYSNPPVLPIVPIRAKKKYDTRFIFVAYDVYPEVAYASQSLKPGSIISRVMSRINKKLYRLVDCVVALTDEMREFLLSNRPELSPDRVVTIANWAHEKVSVPDRTAYERFGYHDGQFIVSYFGNMGTCQDVETMMKAADLLKDDDRIRFLIVGHGNRMASVKRRIRENKLNNVQLHGFLTGEEFQQAVAISSCSIVSLEKGLVGTCAPSKYYSYLQGSKPIIAVVEPQSYLASEVKAERLGFCVDVGDSDKLVDAILWMHNDSEERAQMSKRAGRLYHTRYSYAIAMNKYCDVIRSILGQP